MPGPGKTVLVESNPSNVSKSISDARTGSTKVVAQDRPKTITEILEEALKGTAVGPKLIDPAIAVLAWIELETDAVGWPALVVGEGEPALDIKLQTPWIEDVKGNVLNLQQLIDEATRRLTELYNVPLTEQTKQVTLAGVHSLVPNARVKEFSVKITEGGDLAVTETTASRFGLTPGRSGLTRGETVVVFNTKK